MAYTLKRWLHFQYHMRTWPICQPYLWLTFPLDKSCLLLGLICEFSWLQVIWSLYPHSQLLPVSALKPHMHTFTHTSSFLFMNPQGSCTFSILCVWKGRKQNTWDANAISPLAELCRTITHPIGPVWCSSHNHPLWTHYDSWMWALIRAAVFSRIPI